MFSGEATQVVTRTTEGDIAFLANHAAFIGALDIGEVRVWTDDGILSVAVNGGFVEVSDNTVTILSDQAVVPDDIEVAAVQAALDQARAAMAADPDDDAAKDAVRWAEVRLRVKEAAAS